MSLNFIDCYLKSTLDASINYLKDNEVRVLNTPKSEKKSVIIGSNFYRKDYEGIMNTFHQQNVHFVPFVREVYGIKLKF